MGVESRGRDDLICLDAGRLVHWLGVTTLEHEMVLGTGYEKRSRLVNPVEPTEIDIGSIHDVDGTGFENEFVEDIDLVNFPRSNADEHGDGTTQIQEGVQLHRSFALAELCPRENGKTQVDDGGIEGIRGVVEFHTEILVDIQLARDDADEYLRKIGVDAPIAGFVGMSQRISRNSASNP